MRKTIRTACILFLTVLIIAANTVFSVAETEAVDMGEILNVSDSKNPAYVKRLLDRAYNTRVSYTAGQSFEVFGSEQMGYAYIGWHTLPGQVKITWMDKNKQSLSSQEHAPSLYDEILPVPGEGVYGFKVEFKQEGAVSEVSAFTPGTLPADLPQMKAPIRKPAVMLICGYPGDELACFGGLLPTLAHSGVPVQVVYLNYYNRERQEESIRALWDLGIQNSPVFLPTKGKRSLDAKTLKSNWETNGDVSRELLALIHEYEPSVIVTFGSDRFFPLMSQTEAANLVFTGIFSKIKKGNWLKKVYLLTAKDGKDGAVYDLSGGYERAAEVFKKNYASLRTYHYTPNADDTYALFFTGVGKDTAGDLLENIAYTALDTPAPAATATPEPTQEPTPEPTAEPTEEPTQEPTQEPTMAPTATPALTEAPAVAAPVVKAGPTATPMPRLAETKTVMLPILLSIAMAAVLFGALIALKKLQRKRLPLLVGILVPVLAGMILCVGLYRAASLNQRQAAAADHFDAMLAEEAAKAASVTTAEPTAALTPAPTEEPTHAPTDAPTAAPTEEPTPAPTEAPTPAPTATPDPEEGLYARGEEIVERDEAGGRWSYKSETLSIEIERFTARSSNIDFPYYVADIHMRADELRTGFGDEKRNGMTSQNAITIARKYKAVLLITGDNILNMDREKKGILIRDGWVYNTARKADMMAWHPENRTIELVPKESTISAQLMTEGGVENCISFGPTLILNGEKTGKRILENNWLYKTNPRVGVGMKEPGHFIIVVGGYRSDSPKANLGWNLVEFADLMEELGCEQAYNVDGGVSAAMIFMGERLNQGGSKKDWSALRNLPDGIIFGYSSNVPD